jgi:O-antigen/teichoic acid export membrane protein
MIRTRLAYLISPPAFIVRQSSLMLAARVLGQGLAMLFTLVVARTLGEAAFGRFAFISAVVFVGNVVTTFGLDTLLIRDAAARRSNPPALIGSVLAVQLLLSALYIGGVWLLGEEAGGAAIRIAILSLIPLSFSTVYSAVLRGHERAGAFLLFSLAAGGAAALGGLLVWRGGGGLVAAAAVLPASQLAGAIAAWALCRRLAPGWAGRPRLQRVEMTRAWRAGRALAGLMILAVLYQRLGGLLVAPLAGDETAGWYGAAVRVLEALKLLPGAFFGAMLPVVAAGPLGQARGAAYRRAFIGLLAASVGMGLGAFVTARPLVALLFGPTFDPAALPLRVLSLGLPLTVVAFKLSFELVARGRERLVVGALAVSLAAATVFFVALTPRFGATGAAVAAVASEAVQVTALAVVSRANRHNGS